MEKTLEQARREAPQAEVFRVDYEETPVVFEANRLKQLQARQGTAISLRLIKEGKIGFAAASGEAEPARLVEMALETAQFGTAACFDFPGPDKYPDIDVYDPQVEKVSLEEMVGLGESLIEGVRQHTPELMCECHIRKATAVRSLLNSRGGRSVYKRSVFSLEMEGTLVNGTDMLFVWDSQSSCRTIRTVKDMIQTVVEQLELSRRRASIASGRLPVIFTPKGVASALVTPLAMALNGKIVLQGASPLKDRLGQQVFDKRLSVKDDSTLPLRPESRPCDDEGLPSRPIGLIDRGVVRSFYYDLQTACQAGAASTGSGLRNGGSRPSPSLSTLIIEEGEAGFQNMVRDMKEGLVVEQLMGAGQGNLLGGDFSGNVLLGYRVEKGEIVGRVKDTMVSGNIYNVLNQVVAIGNRASWVGGGLLVPHIYCDGLAVAAKE